jgi:hypothetical protein
VHEENEGKGGRKMQNDELGMKNEELGGLKGSVLEGGEFFIVTNQNPDRG